MSSDVICKIVCQYNQVSVTKEDMNKLQEIAWDYTKVKDYVYQRYGGVRSLSKLYPGYTVQNEMTRSGLRESLGLPTVYFYMAIFDALGDIKSQWTRTKSRILKNVGRNQELSPEEKHYLRYLLKVSNAFEAVVNHRQVHLKTDMQKQYDLLAEDVDTKRLDNYLRRQTRRTHMKISASTSDGFYLTEKAYRYGDHGIYITIKEKRKRIFIPLTDNNQYTRQLYIKLYPEQGNIEIKAPVNVKVQNHQDYTEHVGVSLGMYTMLVTDGGCAYGERLGEYQVELADWIRTQAKNYHPSNEAETGRKKYTAQKQRMTEQLHSYINMELNRFLKTEKPKVIYIPKLPKPQKHSGDKAINNSVNLWQRGYIKKRLRQKCQEQSVEITEVFAKNISNECSRCGTAGRKIDGLFICNSCGYEAEIKQNAAQNAKRRGMENQIIRTDA